VLANWLSTWGVWNREVDEGFGSSSCGGLCGIVAMQVCSPHRQSGPTSR
jgi:hypothetical protein